MLSKRRLCCRVLLIRSYTSSAILTFPGFDPGYPDFYREAEWEREFDLYVAHQNLPNFEIVQLPVDHMGDFETAIAKVNTPETQQADNDYATARLIDRVAHSPYKDSTLIFIVEDDSQDGPDHVDAHRSTAYIVGPYVKHGATVSTYYTTVSVIRTIEDVLGSGSPESKHGYGRTYDSGF